MRKRIGLLLILAFLPPALAGQEKVRDKSQRDAPANETAQRKTEEAQRKAQAVDILKNVVETAPDIEDMQTRVAILTGALDLLWKHDAPFARSNFIKTATAWSDKFASDSTEQTERAEIRIAMRPLLSAFARHDAAAATRLLDKFQKLLEDVSKGYSVSPDERMSVAQASLNSDVVESAALAAKSLEVGVPNAFPAYLIELEQRDPSTAASLFRLALSILSEGRFYGTRDVTILSAYVFRESQVSIPVPSGGFAGAPLEFGFMLLTPLSPPSKALHRSLISAYLAASGAYLNSEAIGLDQRVEPDPNHVGRCFFLTKKLRTYTDRVGLDGGHNWPLLEGKYMSLAERAKIPERTLSGLATVAQRIVTENTVARFDAGESAFAAAEKASDPAERDELIVEGIRQQIEEGKYAEAAQKIAQLRDAEVREQLNTCLAFRTAESSLRKLDWDAFNAQLHRVSDPQLRTYLILSAAVAASEARKKKLSSEFQLAALSSFPKIEDPDARAAAVVATAGILYATTNASWSTQVLTEGVNAINRTSRYYGGVYGVRLGTSKSWVWLPFPKFDLSRCFEQAAKRDWAGALAAAQGIESKALRSRAYIAACRTVL